MSDNSREAVVANISDMLMKHPFTFEFKVVEKPQGIKVIYEVTQAQMDRLSQKVAQKGGEE